MNAVTSNAVYDELSSRAYASNPNLLDNPWFTVNQRAQSSYVWDTDTGYKYTVDRWHAYKPNIQVTSDGIVYAYSGGTEPGSNFSVFRQFIEDYSYLAGKTVTLSTIVNGTLYKATGVFPSVAGDPSISIVLGSGITMYVAFQTGQDYPKVSITNYSTTAITIRAIKLELGSVSTLAMDAPPNYATELLKCQRYFYNANPEGASYAFIGFAECSGTGANSTMYVTVPLPCKMRAKPSITLTGALRCRGGGTIINNTTYAVKSRDLIGQGLSCLVAIGDLGTAVPAEEVTKVSFGNVAGVLQLSADL